MAAAGRGCSGAGSRRLGHGHQSELDGAGEGGWGAMAEAGGAGVALLRAQGGGSGETLTARQPRRSRR